MAKRSYKPIYKYPIGPKATKPRNIRQENIQEFYDVTSNGAFKTILLIFLPILLISIILSYSTYSMYSVFNIEAFTTSVANADVGSIKKGFFDVTHIAVDVYSDNLAKNNLVFRAVYPLVKWLNNSVYGIYQIFHSVDVVAQTAVNAITNLFTGDYFIDRQDAFPDDETFRSYFYNFGSSEQDKLNFWN